MIDDNDDRFEVDLGDTENLKWNQRFNAEAKAAFEKERDRRSDYLHMNERIRRIVGEEINKAILIGMAGVAVYTSGQRYGWLAGAAVFAVAVAIWFWLEKQEEKSVHFKIAEVDELAEDTATHNRIVEMEEMGKEWAFVKGRYLHWGDMFDHPFWENVNRKVRSYVAMSHKRRVEDNLSARARSLPYRFAMEAKLKAMDGEWELPAWAHIRSDERK